MITPSGGAVPAAEPAAQAAAALAIAEHLSVLALGMDRAASLFPAGSSAWSGAAAWEAQLVLAAAPGEFRAVASACREAGAALAEHGRIAAAAAVALRAADQAPVELAPAMRARVGVLLEESAVRAAGRLAGLAGRAPRRQGRLARVFGRVHGWSGELAVGTSESLVGLGGLLARVCAVLDNLADPRTPADLKAAGTGLLDSARHPGELAKAVLDWDTWRSNPARALGHLTPDLIAAILSGGAAAGTRSATVARSGRAAIRAAAQRRASLAAEADGARQALTDRAAARSGSGVSAGGRSAWADSAWADSAWADSAWAGPGLAGAEWRGEGGVGLSAVDAAAVRAFRELSIAAEPRVQAELRAATARSDANLVGLPDRFKAADSLLRKVATVRGTTGDPLPLLLRQVHDALRYTVVIEDGSYVRGALQIARQLEEQGFHPLPVRNAWLAPTGYRGINSHWVDPRTGAAFEVQFHTPQTWQITKDTHPWYEQKRLPNTSAERRAELELLLDAAYRKAPVPDGIETITATTFPPSAGPDPADLPIDYTVHAALAAAAGVQAAQTEQRLAAAGP